MNSIAHQLFKKYPELKCCEKDFEAAFTILKKCYANKGKVMVCGNGGSAADSSHIVGELMKGFKLRRPLPQERKKQLEGMFKEEGKYIAEHLQGALPTIALTSNSVLMTAYANDVAADMIFAQQVYGYAVEGDVLIGISTSGNSLNVVRALQVARVMGMQTIGLTGAGGGRLKELCDVCICVPFGETPDIQERHLPIYHSLCLMLEEEFFG